MGIKVQPLSLAEQKWLELNQIFEDRNLNVIIYLLNPICLPGHILIFYRYLYLELGLYYAASPAIPDLYRNSCRSVPT